MFRASLIPAVTLLVAGCVKGGGDTQTLATATEPAPVQGPPIEQPGDTSAFVRTDVDLNNDGRADAINWTSGGALARKDIDLNQDGRYDVFSFFDASGILSKELMDGDYDGKVDWVDVYAGGARVRAEVDTDYDGKIDTIYHYENGQVSRKERFNPI